MARRYGCWAGDEKGTPEDVTRCVKEIWSRPHTFVSGQCSRKRGYGPGGLYCKQHARRVNQSMVSYNVSKRDARLIRKIVQRAVLECGSDESELWTVITEVHANGCQLRLRGLLYAKKFDFLHDITGILANINRKTGKLRNCFLPRYAKGKEEGD